MQIGISGEAANGLHLDGEFLIVRGERGEASLSEPLFKLLELLIACKQRAAYIDWLRDALSLTQWALYKQVLRLRRRLEPLGWEILNSKGAYRLRRVVRMVVGEAISAPTNISTNSVSSKSANGRTREAFNAYQREYMRRRRAARRAAA